MLSILIPVYNYDVSRLVKELHRQGKQLESPFEIIVFDDGSHSPVNEKNSSLNALENVVFKPLKNNVGRSQNRNLLAQAANYENLLFIDADSLIGENFLLNYSKSLKSSDPVIYGGREHPENYAGKKESLRWKYGKFVEDKPAKNRKKSNYNSTFFNNTLLKKNIFEHIQFERSLTKYGHEDSLLAYELKKRHLCVRHIENPVIHGDIESNEAFMEKTILGLENLKYLCQSGMMDPNYVKLSSIHASLKKYGMDRILGRLYPTFQKPIKKNLTSKNPSLFVFSIFRLTYFCKINLEG